MGCRVACPPSIFQWRRKLSLVRRGEKERRGEYGPTLFKLYLYVSPDCECATAVHNGVHCLFAGESVGFLFQSFLEVLCLTRWGLCTSSVGWRQDCSLCPVSAYLMAPVLSALCFVFSFDFLTVHVVHCSPLDIFCGAVMTFYFSYMHRLTPNLMKG